MERDPRIQGYHNSGEGADGKEAPGLGSEGTVSTLYSSGSNSLVWEENRSRATQFANTWNLFFQSVKSKTETQLMLTAPQ